MLRIALFELRYQLRQPLAWVMCLFFTLMTFLATSTDGVTIGGAIGNIDRNAPWVIIRTLGIMSILGIFITTVFVAGAILRDFDRKNTELMFSRPVSKAQYLGGRFLGAIFISCTIFMGNVVGLLAGNAMPWIDPEQLGPFTVAPYLFGLLVLSIPNLVFTGSVFFALASLTRSMLKTYLGVVGFFSFFFLSRRMVNDLDSQFLSAMIDPFGAAALGDVTKYWTVVERNTMVPEFTGVLLYNRVFWLIVGLVILALASWRFRLSTEQQAIRLVPRWFRRSKARGAPPEAGRSASAVLAPMPWVDRSFDFSAAWQQFVRQTRLELAAVFKGALFVTLLAFGLFNLLASLGFFERIFGTAVYPVTRLMVEGIEGSYAFLLMIIVIFYSGELIWRERSLDLAGVYDSMPVPNWVFFAAKMVAQQVVVLAFLVVGIMATMGYQAAQGYFAFEPMVYARGFLVLVLPFILGCFLASCVQVMAPNKFIGYLLMILFLISTEILDALDFDHNLYRFAATPDAPYSDMNGYGHFVKPLVWFNVYWLMAAAVLTSIAVLFWVRGTDVAWRPRLALARQRFRGPVRWALPLSLMAFIACGSWIFYNTNVLNEYLPDDKREARQAKYEKSLRKYKDADLPRVVDVYVEVDIFPRQRRVEASGRYRLVNKNAAPLTEIHMALPTQVELRSARFGPTSAADLDEAFRDDELGYVIYRLPEALVPGEGMDFHFELTVQPKGFVNSGSDTKLAYNGTFFNNRDYFPTFGYNAGAELQDRNERRKQGLPPLERVPKVDDLEARQNTYLGLDSDWIEFETIVSTSADQTAIAPGYLQKEWEESGRRYFHYKMDAPILHFYSYLSADYTVVRDRWKDVDIEIYHHAPHDYNVDRMIDSIKDSLAYFEENFGPYQHRQMRILEFPGYASFAQSFPNTVPFSESIGFIAKLDEEADEPIDYPYYVTSHEVAHQWWAHQVIGGFVQGATMLSETMSQYSALMVMEEEYGPEKMRRFLKFELDRYLRERSGELVEEMPLMLVENQPYIHYRKGSIIMYALRDYLGEDALNQAVADYVEATKFQQPPFTNTIEFLDFVQRAVPPEKQGLIADFFENITLFENEVDEATYHQRADGKYVVQLATKARKLRADGQGVETEIAIDDWIDIGVFGEQVVDGEKQPTVLFLEKRRIQEAAPSFELVVDELPVRAGIDPYNKLVDRNSNDNLKRVEEEDGGGAAVAAGG